MFITATQIRITKVLGVFYFVPMVVKVRGQLDETNGLLFVKFNGLRTLTCWESYEDMLAFRNNGHHLNAMKNLKKMGKTRSVSWESEQEPGWSEVKTKLNEVRF
jgi:hypothetical protein